jgi:hypothetical protein
MKKILLSIFIVSITTLQAQLNLGVGVGQQYGAGLGSRVGFKFGSVEPNLGVGLAFGSNSYDDQKRNTPVFIYTLGLSYYQKAPRKPFSNNSINDNISYCYTRYVGTDFYSNNFLHFEIHSISKNGESSKIYLGGKLRYGLGIGMSVAPKTNSKIIRGFPIISFGYIYRFGS